MKISQEAVMSQTKTKDLRLHGDWPGQGTSGRTPRLMGLDE